MERMRALERAALIINTARYATVTVNDGAYRFLLRVSARIEEQSREAFAAQFAEVVA